MTNVDLPLSSAAAALDRHRLGTQGLAPMELFAHVTLPLILILAISTQLISVSHSAAIRDVENTISELKKDGAWTNVLAAWRQNFIRRIDLVCDERAHAMRLNLFTQAAVDERGAVRKQASFARVLWRDGFPADDDLKHLFTSAQVLLNPNKLELELYEKVLTYRPPNGSQAEFPMLFDAVLPGRDSQPPAPQDFRVTDEQRAFALEKIRQHCVRWVQLVEMLQIGVVSEVEKEHFRPQGTGDLDTDLANAVAATVRHLEERGYPLLSVARN